MAAAIPLIGLLAGCAGPVESTRPDGLPCPGCRSVTDIHAEAFLRLAADASGACLIHRYRDGEEVVALRWWAMLAPLAKLIEGSRLHLHAWRGEGPVAKKRNVARAGALRVFYGKRGAREPKDNLHDDAHLFLPPYHTLCRSRQVAVPMLELGEGTRLLSGRAAPPVERGAAIEQAGNTFVVTVRREP